MCAEFSTLKVLLDAPFSTSHNFHVSECGRMQTSSANMGICLWLPIPSAIMGAVKSLQEQGMNVPIHAITLKSGILKKEMHHILQEAKSQSKTSSSLY